MHYKIKRIEKDGSTTTLSGEYKSSFLAYDFCRMEIEATGLKHMVVTEEMLTLKGLNL